MMLSERGNDRRDIMATIVQQIHPVAHLPLVLGVLRRLARIIHEGQTRPWDSLHNVL